MNIYTLLGFLCNCMIRKGSCSEISLKLRLLQGWCDVKDAKSCDLVVPLTSQKVGASFLFKMWVFLTQGKLVAVELGFIFNLKKLFLTLKSPFLRCSVLSLFYQS